VNRAKERAIQASTVYSDYYRAYHAVDGDISTLFYSAVKPDDWWRVDLDDVILVRRIVIDTAASKC